MIKVSLIGAGYLGRFHAINLKQLSGAVLKGVYDIDRQRAEKVAKEAETKVFDSIDQAIENSEAIVIATPTTTHYQIAMRTIQAGKDVFIEKPITSTVVEAETLIVEARKKGLIIQVGHLERFNPALEKAEQLLEEPVFYEAERLSPFLGRGIDVDITLDLMIHDIDLVLTISRAPVKELKAVGAKVLTNRVDVAKAWMVLDNKAQACLTASRLSSIKKRLLRIFQDTAMIEIDFQKPSLRVFGKGSSTIAAKEFLFENSNPIKAELQDFINAIKERRPPKVDASQALEAMKIALKISEILGGSSERDTND